jgi:Response regulator containing CheY-like receiver domain and AraC-type DNA-binding domain
MENKPIKILYVDDEPINLRLFQLTYDKTFDVYTAISGQEGLTILEQNNDIEVVISDFRMPVMNGLQFILEAYKKSDKISYYILSGYEQTEEIGIAIKNKIIKKYFMKPFIKSMLENEIKSSVICR